MHKYIIDLETTGIDTKIHEITEVSIIRCSDLVQKTWLLRINNPKTCQPRALAITNKTIKELLSREKDLAEVVEDIDAFIEEDGGKPDERVMIAHNAPFDRRFCENWWQKLGRTFPANMWECTLSMSRKHMKITSPHEKKPKATLIDLIARFKIKAETNYHGAGPDTRNTYRLRDYLLRQGVVKEIQFIKKSEAALKREKENITSNDCEVDMAAFDFDGEEA